MALIVFRSRLAPDCPESYGERVALVEFETETRSRAWAAHPEHRKAQQEGRDLYYSEYSLQI
ncbi:MAG TPA: hypothetical protein VMW19_16910 [Myxococcota bacterium]|nr:hypothetical protein [Myxococcota bacterium]